MQVIEATASGAAALERGHGVNGLPAGAAAALSPIATYLERLHSRFARVQDGAVADYIPELARADPSWFGICLVTADGAVYEAGDTRRPFTLQSISKPLAYGAALERSGVDEVRRRIGVEPSGEAFNAISLDPDTGAPRNPMINAGAIAATWLATRGAQRPFETILDCISRFAGRRLALDEAVFASERDSGFRNRAIAHLLRNAGVIDGDPDAAADLYFRQCAVAVECRDLGMIAATLANDGVNPHTGQRALEPAAARDVLGVMSSCGMYDSAGAWLVEVGLPAKSGVSGGILAVLPGRLGLGVFSPPLDERGNSVRGLAVCRAISDDHALHLVRPGTLAPSPIRARLTLAESRSKRIRSAREQVLLRELGHRAVAFQLQGELDLGAVELVSRRVRALEAVPRIVVLDLARVTRVQPAAVTLLSDLARGLSAHECGLALSGAAAHGLADLVAPGTEAVPALEDLDRALEWCETELLAHAGGDGAAPAVDLRDHEMIRNLAPDDLDVLLPVLRERRYEPGAVLFEEGDRADSLYLVTRGELSVTVRTQAGSPKRVATLSAGVLFGELALVDGEPRTATVTADTPVVCHVLPFAELARLETARPGLRAALLEGILRVVGRTARRLSVEVSALAE